MTVGLSLGLWPVQLGVESEVFHGGGPELVLLSGLALLVAGMFQSVLAAHEGFVAMPNREQGLTVACLSCGVVLAGYPILESAASWLTMYLLSVTRVLEGIGSVLGVVRLVLLFQGDRGDGGVVTGRRVRHYSTSFALVVIAGWLVVRLLAGGQSVWGLGLEVALALVLAAMSAVGVLWHTRHLAAGEQSLLRLGVLFIIVGAELVSFGSGKMVIVLWLGESVGYSIGALCGWIAVARRL